MIDFYEELQAVAGALDRQGVPWALIGAMAVAVYATSRATQDVDLLVPAGALGAATAALEPLGYRPARDPTPVAGGRLHIQRLLRIDAEDLAILDLLLAEDEATRGMLERRVRASDGERTVWVVSAEDLRVLKRLRGSAQDRADLEALGRAQEGEV